MPIFVEHSYPALKEFLSNINFSFCSTSHHLENLRLAPQGDGELQAVTRLLS